ncbi:MAG: NfeD family protein [Lachnospiraceae bacterium]|nr:NfeD family protein [Lachnospiraceae bacterium]
MESMGWLIACVIFILIEMATLSLTSVWFAIGAFAAGLASLAGANMTWQIIIFLVVSIVVLVVLRSPMLKVFNKKRTKTNYEGIIGLDAKVIETINNDAMTGTAIVNGQEWTARALKDDMIIEAGTKAKIVNISGVKLILSNKSNKQEEEQ